MGLKIPVSGVNWLRKPKNEDIKLAIWKMFVELSEKLDLIVNATEGDYTELWRKLDRIEKLLMSQSE